MPNARARLDPTTSITTEPTMARMICVWMTGACRGGVPRRRGRSASTHARPAATGSRVTAWRSWSSCVPRSGVSVSRSPLGGFSIFSGVDCAAASTGVRSISTTHSERSGFKGEGLCVPRGAVEQGRCQARRMRRYGRGSSGAQLAGRASVAGARIPLSTYRVQFNAKFTFTTASAIVAYLDELGISGCYASSYLAAVPVSPHGYDVADPTRLNPDLGTDEDYWRWIDALRTHGMGHILDVVPNHMGIAKSANPWWLDVLENGPCSRFARIFDIEWRPVKSELADKLLIPILGDQYGEVLERQELTLVFRHGAFAVQYHDETLPVAPDTYATIFSVELDELLPRP